MTIEEMKNHLTQIQNESVQTQTKMLNAILTSYAEIKNLEIKVIELQEKINEIITFLNKVTVKEDAETVNPEEDAPVNEPVPQVSEEDK